MKKLLVIDANSILNRAFYAVAPLTSPSGVPTNAVFGLLNSVLSQWEALAPDTAVAAFDVKAPTFRHQMYDAYKAGRRPAPPDLLAQFPVAKDCLRALGFYVAECPGFEADDILGTFAREAGERGDYLTYLLTGDRDSLQLIDDRTTVLLAGNRETAVMDIPAFTERYGVSPDRFVDVKALMGDSSDNIPGVPGIGEKTALKLISSYGTLDALYAALPSAGDIPAGQKEKLTAGRESAYLSRTLAAIDRNAALGFSLADAERVKRDDRALRRIFSELGFVKLTERLALHADKLSLDPPADAVCSSPSDVLAAARTGVSVLFLLQDGSLAVRTDGICRILTKDVLPDAAPLFDGSCRLICHDLKALCTALHTRVRGCVFDTMLAAYILDSAATDYSLDALAAKYPPSDGCAVVYLSELEKTLRAELEKIGALSLLTDIEIPVAEILYEMEQIGSRVDIAGLTAFGKTLSAYAGDLEKRICFLAGREFNINSPKQLGTVLFDEMKLKAPKKTKNGYSTASDVLEKLAPENEIVSLVLEYRHVTKLNSTFVEGLCHAADEDGRVHTTFHQSVTATGRLSSTDPNLQNIPIRTELGRELRRFFIPTEGYLLADADYSQIELRLMAHISGDENLKNAFLSGEDIHTSTAAAVFGVPEELVTPELRKRAKAVNFGIIYGIGEFSLSEDLHISRREARSYIDSYKARFPGVSRYLEEIVAQARENGYVTTVFGRRRSIPELKSGNRNLQAFGERVAMNSPIQGSAADIIKLAMIRVTRRFERELPTARLLLQVHDELLAEAPASDIDLAAKILAEEMENAVKLTVPLPAESGTGNTWLACH